MHTKVDEQTVRHVASIARLALSEAEVSKFTSDLNEILDAFRIIDEADVKGVEPSFQPLPIKDVTRSDAPERSLSQDEALANTKHRERGFFKGPSAV